MVDSAMVTPPSARWWASWPSPPDKHGACRSGPEGLARVPHLGTSLWQHGAPGRARDDCCSEYRRKDKARLVLSLAVGEAVGRLDCRLRSHEALIGLSIEPGRGPVTPCAIHAVAGQNYQDAVPWSGEQGNCRPRTVTHWTRRTAPRLPPTMPRSARCGSGRGPAHRTRRG